MCDNCGEEREIVEEVKENKIGEELYIYDCLNCGERWF